jgi:hypothetical protein
MKGGIPMGVNPNAIKYYFLLAVVSGASITFLSLAIISKLYNLFYNNENKYFQSDVFSNRDPLDEISEDSKPFSFT